MHPATIGTVKGDFRQRHVEVQAQWDGSTGVQLFAVQQKLATHGQGWRYLFPRWRLVRFPFLFHRRLSLCCHLGWGHDPNKSHGKEGPHTPLCKILRIPSRKNIIQRMPPLPRRARPPTRSTRFWSRFNTHSNGVLVSRFCMQGRSDILL